MQRQGAGRQAAIVGIGATEFSKNSGRSELRLAVEAAGAALDDCGMAARQVDGLVTVVRDNSDERAVARNLGLADVAFFARATGGGGGSCSAVILASLAVEAGLAEAVVVYRALNERSQQRLGQPVGGGGLQVGAATSEAIDLSWHLPFGMVTAASFMAPSAQRYLHRYNVGTDAFGQVAVTQRAYANDNPAAYFHDVPMSLTDHASSRLVADPLRLLDCCQESDGAVALVVTTLERARNLRRTPVTVLAAAAGLAPALHAMATVYRDDAEAADDTRVVGEQLWARSGLRPADVDVANIYDNFTCAVLMQLEALGFCAPGEASGFVADGALGPGGALPTNTNGGQLSEAYIQGFNGIAEVVRQLRGTAANQVPGAARGLVTAGPHVPTSGLLLGAA